MNTDLAQLVDLLDGWGSEAAIFCSLAFLVVVVIPITVSLIQMWRNPRANRRLESIIYLLAIPYAAAAAWVARVPDGDLEALWFGFAVLGVCYVAAALFAATPFRMEHFTGHALAFALATWGTAVFLGRLDEMAGMLSLLMPGMAIATVALGAIVQHNWHYLRRRAEA